MSDRFIDVTDATFTYESESEEAQPAVKRMNFQVKAGEHVAVLGRNGSGKSTLARMLNALLLPQHGKVLVLGCDTADEEKVLTIRSALGMVFQNPDNQIVGTTVEEDVAFGPENLGMPREEMQIVVPRSLKRVGLEGFEKRQPSELSGGQKQKLAVAGILAMEPSCIILDEATAMLDPQSRKELLDLVSRLQHERGLTLINVTHHMDEVLRADRVMVMSHGEKVMEGTPAEVFYQREDVKRLGLDVPAYVELSGLVSEALQRPLEIEDTRTCEAAVSAVERLLREADEEELKAAAAALPAREEPVSPDYEAEPLIEVEHLSHAYNQRRPDEIESIHDLSFKVWPGEFLGIAGHTGSGKSTLIQHLNGLIRPQQGKVRIMGLDASDNKDIRELRRYVGMVFQYPEQQLFAETIYDDVAFGPGRLGFTEEETRESCLKALRLAGLSHIDLERSPFELSGGQMRRVAIAGILAMKPKILILDEPAAGLDPQGREEIFRTLLELRREGVTVLLVSHSMDDLARLADRILVMSQGQLQAASDVHSIFSDREMVLKNHLALPAVMTLAEAFQDSYPSMDPRIFTEEDLAFRLLEEELKMRTEGRAEAGHEAEVKAESRVPETEAGRKAEAECKAEGGLG